MTTAVSIPDPVFQSADRLAEPLRVSRSELLRTSLDDVAQSARLSPYNKWVDASESTPRIVQKIYDADGVLVEVHQKYPEDLGHVRLV